MAQWKVPQLISPCYTTLVVRGFSTPHVEGEHHKWPTNGGISYITLNPWGVYYTLQFQK